MSFVNAGLLGLGALFAIPLIIHLLNRRRYKRVQWAAMDFLLRAYKQNRRRLRLESLLLLLLRCAIPILLALAVARPRFASGVLPATTQGPHHVFVLDRSYSMGYRGIGGATPFDRMKQIVSTLLDRIAQRPNEKVSLVYLGVEVTTPVRGDLEVARAQKAVARLERPSDGRAELRAGIRAAAKLAAGEPEPARIYVFSDFQKLTLEADTARTKQAEKEAETPTTAEGGIDLFRDLRDMCADLEQAGSEVVLFPLAPEGQTSNSQIRSLALDPENAVAGVASTVRAELIHNGPEPKDVLVRLRVDGGNEQTRRVRLRPEQAMTETFSVRFLEAGMHSVTVQIDEDELPVDDTRRLVTKVRDRIRVLLVEGRDTANEEEILTHSFLYKYLLDPTQGEGDLELRTFQTQVVDEDRFQSDPSFVQNQDVIALLNVTAPRRDVAQRLVEFVETGGGLWLAPGPNSLPNQYNALLFGVGGETGPMPLRLVELGGFKGFLGTGKGAQIPSRYATPKVAQEEDAHPMLVDFEAAELRTFLEALPVYRYWSTSRIDKPETTRIPLDLAGSDEQDRPALIATRRYGQGECVLLTSNLSRRPDRWNRLDVYDPVAFPLIHSLTHYLARDPKESLNRLVGQPLTTWIADQPKSLYMHRPNERGRVPLTVPKAKRTRAGTGSAGWDTPPFEDTVDAGTYRLAVEYVEKTKAASDILFAVNPDPREGVLDYVRADTLGRELPSVDVRTDGVEVEVGSAIEANTSEWGRWLLILALLAAVGESVLASWMGGNRRS